MCVHIEVDGLLSLVSTNNTLTQRMYVSVIAKFINWICIFALQLRPSGGRGRESLVYVKCLLGWARKVESGRSMCLLCYMFVGV